MYPGRSTPHPAPELPAVLPSLAGTELLRALQAQARRVRFMAEHLDHPQVPQAVAEGVTDALAELDNAVAAQTRNLWGSL